jgi:hypothetical protein
MRSIFHNCVTYTFRSNGRHNNAGNVFRLDGRFLAPTDRFTTKLTSYLVGCTEYSSVDGTVQA